jgi:arylsulfatase A-like enzyme/Tfp pilus assembly protein PilF
MGPYGYSRDTTPNIDALAAEGTLFNHAISPVGTTLPSHCTIMTGITPLHHRVHANVGYQLDESQTTLAELLRDDGFETAAFIGAYVLDSVFGLAQGFDTYDDNLDASHEQAYLNERSAAQTTDLANAWLTKHRRDKFFLFIHYYDPHDPYVSHKARRFPSLPMISFRHADFYDSEIAYTDQHVGMVIEHLKRLGLYDSTLLIVTGDHGESFGEHSEPGHGFFIYHSTVHVPLIIKAPGQSSERTINNVVGLIDIVQTVCSLTGVEAPDNVQGMDLSNYLRGIPPPEEDRYLFSESMQPTTVGAAPLTSLTTNRWKYIHSVRPELYDLLKDPRETENLVDKAPREAQPIKDELLEILAQYDEEGLVTGAKPMSDQTLARLRSLGYVGGVETESVSIHDDQKEAKDLVGAWVERNKIADLIAEKKFDEAKKRSLELLEQYPGLRESSVHEFLASQARKEGDYDSAMSHLDRLLAFDYNPYKVHISYGEVLSIVGRYKEAIEHLEASIALEPDAPYAYMSLATTFAAAERFPEAVRTTEKALELATSKPRDRSSAAHAPSSSVSSRNREGRAGADGRTRAADLLITRQAQIDSRASSPTRTSAWISLRRSSVRRESSSSSRAASGARSPNATGRPKRMAHLEGSGTAPNGPSTGKVGVTGR